ncbi:hypothetical protein [Cytobacillus dafuensis]|uniref:Uncharacterized protein n=1 Tax=Cytobacillus dafuensis TaxID=1742359 RepID=A0A5B8Z195_CYTDA|nr:hypothetical protein [Cytobacillus dafuensis]QED46638.1 hypothetical protein FSZ17_04745 [Cytobacillus dafuensis]
MRILLYEIRKAFHSPIILGLLGIFIAFNFFLIYENSFIKDDLHKVNQFADKYGTEINDEMLDKMKQDYEAQMKKVNEKTNEVLSKTYESMDEFYSDQSFYPADHFNEKELLLFNDIALLEYYYFTSLHLEESFQNIDPIAIAELEIKQYGISGQAAELIRSQYGKFTERYQEVLENKEYKHLFPSQRVFETHLLLFKKMFKAILIESLILTVLVTAYIINFEFDKGTYLIAYSSKRGRGLWGDKLRAALIINVLLFTIILAVGMIAYFSVFSYKEFWHVPISNFFNAGKEWFMSWWNFSFLEYLAACIVLAYLLIILFTMMTAILARYVRNSYLVFFIFLCLFGVIFANQGIIPRSSIAFLLGYFTPVNLVLNSFVWFMHRAVTFTAYFEVITVVVWFVILLFGVLFCARSFRKCDLK